MPILSAQQLRRVFKGSIEELLQHAENSSNIKTLLPQIQDLSERLEKTISQKVQMLEEDFHDFKLTSEYLRTITESFDDLDRLLRSSQTFADALYEKGKPEVLHHIKVHYSQVLVPLLNIMSKLENDYISIATQCIFRKQENLNKVQINLQKLKIFEKNLTESLFVFGKEKKLKEIHEKLIDFDLERQFLQLSLHHDRLNLYYFNHDHPDELKEIKQKADMLKAKLEAIREEYTHE